MQLFDWELLDPFSEKQYRVDINKSIDRDFRIGPVSNAPAVLQAVLAAITVDLIKSAALLAGKDLAVFFQNLSKWFLEKENFTTIVDGILLLTYSSVSGYTLEAAGFGWHNGPYFGGDQSMLVVPPLTGPRSPMIFLANRMAGVSVGGSLAGVWAPCALFAVMSVVEEVVHGLGEKVRCLDLGEEKTMVQVAERYAGLLEAGINRSGNRWVELPALLGSNGNG